MSRKHREMEIEARERWPHLRQFFVCYVGQDWPYEFGTIDAAVDQAVADYDLAMLKAVAREWWDWNASKGALQDPRDWVAAVEVNRIFATPDEARGFMNSVYDKLIVSIRHEERSWKPAG